MLVVLTIHPLLRRLFDSIYVFSGGVSGATSQRQNGGGSPFSREQNAADGRLEQRIAFDLIFGLIFIIALHGVSAAKVLIILYINYSLATNLKRENVSLATWVFNIGILFANELGEGYRMTKIAHVVLFSENNAWAASLDSYGGLLPRWEVLFKITILRLISFNFDYIWSLDQSGSSALEVSLPLNPSTTRLMHPRRNNSTLPTSLSATASPSQHHPPPTPSVTTSPTPFTLHSSSPVPS